MVAPALAKSPTEVAMAASHSDDATEPTAGSRSEEVRFSEPPTYLADALEDAERLLKYAAERGTKVDSSTRDSVLQARAAQSTGWTKEAAASLLAALASLTAQLAPTTAESLKACKEDIRATIRGYTKVALWLTAFIVPFSMSSFVATGLSNAIRTDIDTANKLVVKLLTQVPAASAAPSAASSSLQTNPALLTDLQQFAATVRAIDARGHQLRVLVFGMEQSVTLPNKGQLSVPVDPRNDTETMARTYQEVRSFGQNLVDDVSISYGAITTCILPVLYALLGTCAYLLRSFERQMATCTFIPSVAHSERFLIAGIGGAVVGLFNNFAMGQGASIPPLAIAFLVGYAVDVFFAFLEGLLQSFAKTGPGSSAAASIRNS
jgi:hypothetical protein